MPEMSLRIWSISAHFSRWPTPNSGFRIACWTRSSPVDDQAGEPSPVRPLGSGLVLDPPRGLGPIELLGGQRPQLLVRLEELHLPVAHFERLAVPLAQLLGQPDRVLLGVEHVEGVTCGE